MKKAIVCFFTNEKTELGDHHFSPDMQSESSTDNTEKVLISNGYKQKAERKLKESTFKSECHKIIVHSVHQRVQN